MNIRTASVTGGFIIFDDSGLNLPEIPGAQAKTGLYLRDMDPVLNPPDTSDLLIERAPSSIVKNLKISMDIHWNNQFFFDKDNEGASDFFYKPLNAAKTDRNKSDKDRGYWSYPFQLSENDLTVITYSCPLTDASGRPYAVMGIEVTTDYLHTMMPYTELDANRNGAYILGIDSGNNNRFLNIFSNGPLFKRFTEQNVYTDFEKDAVSANIYPVTNEDDMTGPVYGSIQNLNLYNPGSPFSDDKWAVIGIISKENLLSSSINLRTSLTLSFIISLLIGLSGIILAGIVFTKPIVTLAACVRTSDPDKPIILPKCSVFEINQLAGAIENLSERVLESASRVSQIIDLVNIPIGAFSFYKNEDKVFCSTSFCSIVDFDDPACSQMYLPKSAFQAHMSELQRYKDSSSEDTYHIVTRAGNDRWIRIKKIEDSSKILGIVIDVSEEMIEKHKIEYERDYDSLTKLYNHRAFKNIVTHKLETENMGTAAIVMWNIDNLKFINDTYGHDIGDNYIVMTANVLQKLTVGSAVATRISGDEFFTFLYGYKDKDSIRDAIQHILKQMSTTFMQLPDGQALKIRASAGLSWYPDNSVSFDELVKYADFAMYQTKKNVKGSITEFDLDIYNRDSFLFTCGGELDRIIDEELIEYAFQPIVDAHTGEIFAYEALMRSKSPVLKFPLDIIRIARVQAKLYQIEHLTWFKSLESFERKQELFGNARLFINSIPSTILNDTDIGQIETRYKKYLDRIVVELLEGDQSTENQTAQKQEIVSRWNGHTAIDDFGAGYNNELILLSVSPDYVKIDMSIVQGITDDKNRQKMIHSLISYSKSRNIKVVAEGVETRNDMEMLVRYGVDYIQGYYLGKPEFIPQQIPQNVIDDIKAINDSIRFGAT